jgi:heme/copper-type cytochrome/quinol oxidase subunit 2
MFMGRVVLASGHTKAGIIRPIWLTKIFLGGDILSFLVQAAGARMLVKTDASQSTRDLGKYIVLVRLIIQVLVFGFFLIVAALFHLRAKRVEETKGQLQIFNWQK